MFDSLIDNLNAEKWQELDMASKNEADWLLYHVNIHHKIIDDTTIAVMVAVDDGDPKTVEIKDTKPNTDPVKQVGRLELILNADATEIIGMDLDGDIVVRK